MTEKEYTREEMLEYMPEEYVDLHFAKDRFKGCPFCGAKPKTWIAVGGFCVGCSDDENCYRFSFLHKSLEELIKRWNRRDGKDEPN